MAADLLSCGVCSTLLAGWLDAGTRLLKQPASGDDGVRGAVFVVLSSRLEGRSAQHVRESGFEWFTESGTRVSGIADLFAWRPAL
jgi:hypothetical protein